MRNVQYHGRLGLKYDGGMLASLEERLHPPAHALTPASHLGLTWRRASVGDLAALDSLVRITEDDNAVVRRTPTDQLKSLLGEAEEARYADGIVGIDARGIIQAFGAVRLYREDREVARAELFAATMPKWRGRGIGRALLTWQDARARQLLIDHWGADSRLPARISNVVEAHQRDRRQLYAAAGFTPSSLIGVYRHQLDHFSQCSCEGIRPIADVDLSVVEQLHARASRDVGASAAQAARWWRRVAESLDPDLSLVHDGDGGIDAYALVCRHSTTWLAGVDADASIESYGPGLSAPVMALLTCVMHAAHSAGLAGLSTEAPVATLTDRSPELQKLGFSAIGVRMVYTIDL